MAKIEPVGKRPGGYLSVYGAAPFKPAQALIGKKGQAGLSVIGTRVNQF